MVMVLSKSYLEILFTKQIFNNKFGTNYPDADFKDFSKRGFIENDLKFGEFLNDTQNNITSLLLVFEKLPVNHK